MSERALGRRFRRWQVMAVCLGISVAALGLIGWGALGAWQGLTDNPDSVSAASASSVPVTSLHCSGSSPAYSSCSDTSGRVQLFWSAVSGSPGITVQRATSPSGAYSTIATLAGTATAYTDTTTAYNAQYYYEVFSGAPGWASAAEDGMALSLPPTGGTDNTAGTGGTSFTAANLTAMSVAADGSTYTTSNRWGGPGAQIMENAQVFGVTCISSTQCWAVGQSGAIWSTSDFGFTWTEQTAPPPANRNLNGVDMLDSQHGFIVGQHGTIYSTSNGGGTWSSQSTPINQDLDAVSCVSTSRCEVVGQGGTILSTSDGGTTWTQQTSPSNQDLLGVSCVSTTQCWAVGKAGTILVTSNGGTTWSAQTDPNNHDLYSVDMLSTSTGWAVGQGGTILHTINGGVTWTAQTDPNNNDLRGVSCIGTSQCWAVGNNGTILTTSNSGATWTVQTSGTNQQLNAVSAIDDDHVMVGANPGGGINSALVTHDGGQTWHSTTAQYLQWTFSPTVAPSAPVSSAVVTLVDAASGNPNGTTQTWLLVSTDAGSTWTWIQIANPTTTLAAQTESISSLLTTASAVSGLELRYEITDNNGFTTKFDLVHVDIN